MQKVSLKELILITSILLKTPKTSVAVVVDKTEHENIVSKIQENVSCLYNKINNTVKFDGILYLLHNEHSTTHGKKFNHTFYYSGNPKYNVIKTDYSYIVDLNSV